MWTAFWTHFSTSLRVELAYRLLMVQRFFGVGIGSIGAMMFWLTVSDLAQVGYPEHGLLCYFTVILFHDFLFLAGNEVPTRLGALVKDGRLSSLLLRPFPFRLQVVAQALAGLLIRSILLVPIVAVVSFFVLSKFRFSDFPLQISLYLLAMISAVAMNMVLSMITGFCGFFTTHVWAPTVIYVACVCVFGGMFFPPDLAPAWMQQVMVWTPFYYLVGFPVLLLLGRIEGAEIWFGFGREAIILVLCLFILNGIWRAGVKRYEAVAI